MRLPQQPRSLASPETGLQFLEASDLRIRRLLQLFHGALYRLTAISLVLSVEKPQCLFDLRQGLSQRAQAMDDAEPIDIVLGEDAVVAVGPNRAEHQPFALELPNLRGRDLPSALGKTCRRLTHREILLTRTIQPDDHANH